MPSPITSSYPRIIVNLLAPIKRIGKKGGVYQERKKKKEYFVIKSYVLDRSYMHTKNLLKKTYSFFSVSCDEGGRGPSFFGHVFDAINKINCIKVGKFLYGLYLCPSIEIQFINELDFGKVL